MVESEPMSEIMYLRPGGTSFERRASTSAPSQLAGCVRVVCISDTHNEHAALRLPKGDLLIHSGDCLTESGLRHVLRKAPASEGQWQEIVTVKTEGRELFERFAKWFGEQQFEHKVFVAGNHDLVVQGLGKARVQAIFDEYCSYGHVIYLEHEEVTIANLRVFGSPYHNYSSHNDAFKLAGVDYADVPNGIDIMVTHAPNILPKKTGTREDRDLGQCLHRTGASLHVSGHCHWAYGLYFSEDKGHKVPCVNAAVCSGEWIMDPSCFASEGGVRGDPVDFRNGGYNIHNPPIMCDLLLHAGPLSAMSAPITQSTRATLNLGASSHAALVRAFSESEAASKPRLLFFGPPNDPETIQRLTPQLCEFFHIDVADSEGCGVQLASAHSYVACVAKLGTKGNKGTTVIEALRMRQGDVPFVVVHSATAKSKPDTCARLVAKYHVNRIFDHDSEVELVEALMPLANSAILA